MHLTVCCPYCGKTGRLPNGFNESSATCPGCHRLFTIAEASSPRSGEPSRARQGAAPAPPVESRVVPPAIERRPTAVLPTPSRPVSDLSKPLPNTASDQAHEETVFRPAPSSGRPFWKDPVVLIPTSIITIILMSFFGYLHFQWSKEHLRHEIMRVKEQGDRYLAKRQNGRAFERYDSLLKWVGNADPGDEQSRATLEIVRRTRDQLLPEVASEGSIQSAPKSCPIAPSTDEEVKKPIRLEGGALIAAAKLFAMLNIHEVFNKIGAVEDMKILNIDVRPLTPDARMVPWLWECTATIAVTWTSQVPGVAPTSNSAMWRSLFQFTPESSGGECWREITESRSGETTRKHFQKSEWNQRFRSDVSAAWFQTFEKYTREMKQASYLSPIDKTEELDRYKKRVAGEFQITVDELSEILEATE